MQNEDSTAPVLFNTYPTDCGHAIAEITLNAPKSLNALSVDMCEHMNQQLLDWAQDDNIVAVLLRGAGDKAFCAGGDIRKLYDSMLEAPPMPNPYATHFFGSEYALYRQMHFYNKPLILWGNGFVIGGGMGLMSACSHRIVTETTKFAMPEITIGLFPDAGGSWFLQRMPAKTGLFLGLTGALCNANDALLVNLAEYALSSERYTDVITALTGANWQQAKQSVNSKDAYDVTSRSLAVLRNTDSIELKPSKLAQYWQPIQTLMTSGGIKEIDAILRDDDQLSSLDSDFAAESWTQKAVATYRHGCPVTAVLTYEIYHKVGDLSLEQILYLESNVAAHCANNPDFKEGVRALLIDKDKSPNWSRTLAECTSAEGMAYINSHFDSPYPEGQHPFSSWLSEQAYGAKAVI